MKGCEMRKFKKADCLFSIWLRKELKDFFKMGVSASSGEMKMTACEWQELQKHCEKALLSLQAQEFKGIKVWIAYYTELKRICAFKLAEFEKRKRWDWEFLPEKTTQERRKEAKSLALLERAIFIAEKIVKDEKEGF